MRAVRRWMGLTAAVGALAFTGEAAAQAPAPSVVDPKLKVETVTTGLAQPVQMEFLKDHDFLVLEKATGQVQRIKNGGPPTVVLDLAVNSASARARPAPTAPRWTRCRCWATGSTASSGTAPR